MKERWQQHQLPDGGASNQACSCLKPSGLDSSQVDAGLSLGRYTTAAGCVGACGLLKLMRCVHGQPVCVCAGKRQQTSFTRTRMRL